MKFDEPLDSEDEELPTLSAGYILGDRYRIIEVRGRTRHNVLYNARHTETGRSFVVKKPRSRDRIEKLRGEGARAITAREQVIEGVVSVFDTGEHGGIPYLVMEEVKGDDIRQLRKQKTFEPREIVRIYEKVVRTIKGYSGGSITHCDIKEGNVMLCDSTGEAVIVDWGERRSQLRYATDTQAAAAIAFALLVDYKDRTGKSIPGNLEKILEEARSDEAMTPDKALNDIQHYHQIPRRRWKKAAYVTAGLLTAGATWLGGEKTGLTESLRREYLPNSLEKLVDRNEERELSDEEFNQIRAELFARNVKRDIKELPPGTFPFATINDKWFTTSKPDYANGYWAGILIEGWKQTGDPIFEKAARRNLEEITISEKEDMHYTTAIRFFYSHARMYDATEGREEIYRDKALEGMKRLGALFDVDHNFLPLRKKGTVRLDASTMADLVPAYWWASQHALTENDRQEYRKRALAQTRSILKHNKMPDGFFAQSAIIDPLTHERVTQENQDALSSLESVSRTQAMVLRGLMEDYHHTRDEGMLKEARNLAEAFLKYMPVDSLPRSDLKSGKGAPPDSSTYVFAVKPLVELTKATNDPRYQEAARRMRRILVRDSLSTNTDSAGIIKHNCLSAKNDWYTDSSLIFVDYTFLTD